MRREHTGPRRVGKQDWQMPSISVEEHMGDSDLNSISFKMAFNRDTSEPCEKVQNGSKAKYNVIRQ